MLFKNVYLRSFRLFLFPLSVLYGGIIRLRNYLYDREFIGAVRFNLPIIGVGNLSVGGTGKSPMVDYLAGLLKKEFAVATLSRGYKRRTSGYVLANSTSTSIEIGDEPMQFHLSHPEIAVAVGEKRIEAVPQLLYDRPETKIIILDDAFQHREIKSGMDIILTDFSNLYTRDFYLPTGDLRDQKRNADKSDIIVVTKCPDLLSQAERYRIMKELDPQMHQKVFFTTITYDTPYHIFTKEKKPLSKQEEVLLICGIANPEPLTTYIHEATKTYDAIFFNDHHIYTIDDINEMKYRYEHILTGDKIFLTTEKDAVRLFTFQNQLRQLPFYVLPISISFLFDQEEEFNDLILNYPRTFYKTQVSNKQSA